MALLTGCLRRILLLAAFAALLAVGWHFRGPLRSAWRELRGAREGGPLVPTAELADAAEHKLARLGRGAPGPVALSEAELQSLLQYRLADTLLGPLADPHVELDGGRVRLRARVPTDRLPSLPELGQAIGLLPDTTEIVATAQLLPLEPGRAALAVDEIRAAKIPLPRRLIPTLLRRLGRRPAPGLPPDAIAVPLPPGATAAYVRGDSLVFLARPPGPDTR